MIKINIKEILDANPQIDREALNKSMELMRQLKQKKMKKRGYHLASPHTRRRTQSTTVATDSRTVQLGSRY